MALRRIRVLDQIHWNYQWSKEQWDKIARDPPPDHRAAPLPKPRVEQWLVNPNTLDDLIDLEPGSVQVLLAEPDGIDDVRSEVQPPAPSVRKRSGKQVAWSTAVVTRVGYSADAVADIRPPQRPDTVIVPLPITSSPPAANHPFYRDADNRFLSPKAAFFTTSPAKYTAITRN